MADDVTVVGCVQVDVAKIGEFAKYVAIPVSEPLHAVYEGPGCQSWVRPVYGFTAQGIPLVLNEDGTRLVHAREELKQGREFRVRRPDPPVTGPFSPAPAGMIAVFHDGRRMPVVFYDVHGRAVLIDDDPHCSLALAAQADGLGRIEGGPIAEP